MTDGVSSPGRSGRDPPWSLRLVCGTRRRADLPAAVLGVAARPGLLMGGMDRIFRRDLSPDTAGKLATRPGRPFRLPGGLPRPHPDAPPLPERSYTGTPDR